MPTEHRERIALVLGVPTTQRAFRKRLETGEWDLMRGRPPHVYDPVLSIGADLAACASSGGMTVYENARLKDLRAAARSHDVFILLAHWRGATIDADDLLHGWVSRLEGAQDERDTPMSLLLREIGPRPFSVVDETDFDNRQSVAVAMNRLLESGALRKFLPSGLHGSITTHPLILATLCRDLLDAEFGDALQPGNQLELTDGLHPPGAIHEAIGDFTGTVDLSCCTSSVPGTLLKMYRGDTIKVFLGDHNIPPAPHMRMLEHVLRLIIDDPTISYADARPAVAHGLYDAHLAASRP